MKKGLGSLLFITFFLILCVIPSVGMLIAGPSGTVANEIPAPAPAVRTWDGKLNQNLLPDLSAWIGQNFALRKEAVTGWAGLNAALFRTSVTPDILLGKNGWLYYEPTRADYTGAAPMTDREIWCAARTLALLQEYAESTEADFFFTVAPDKNSLYDENMPALTRTGVLSNAERFSRRLGEMGVRYVDLFAVFRAQDEVLYYPTDSHWNGRGAALAADAILAVVGRESGYYTGAFSPGSHRGDLYEMLYPAGRSEDADYTYSPGFTFTADSQNPDSIVIRTRNDAGEGRLLLYRDSFGRNLYPYLAESFREASFSRKAVYDPTSLTAGDVMGVELVERNLRYLNENVPAFPSPLRTELPAAAVREEEIKLTLANGGGTEYTVLRGVFGDLMPDDDSPVYVIAGETCYEALPQPDGFSACLSSTETALPLQICFSAGGEWVSLPGRAE